MERRPAAFLSYVRFNDHHDEGRISQLRERLEGEVRVHTGEDFPIFQDRADIRWGQEWQVRLDGALDVATFFIPILTPSFFKSAACRQELEMFLARERKLGRRDLVLPLYYVDAPLFNDPLRRAADALAAALASRQYVDWRDLRLEPFTDPQVGKRLASLAVQIRDSLERLVEAAPPNGADSATRTSWPGASELRPGSPSKKEPPTHVVDPWHRGDFPTIGQAIQAAKPGDRILIRPGLYEEGLVLDKPLEILGDGRVEEIVVQAKGFHALLFRSTLGRVTNLTLRQEGEGDWYAVNITQGRLELEGCDISSQICGCVEIHGNASPRLRRNRIHDGKAGGVFFYENGKGTLEDNEIFGNTAPGVEIMGDADPVLRRNRIYHGKSSAVYVHTTGKGLLEDNEIFGNTLAAVAIQKGGDPVLRRNRIRNGNIGVLIYESGKGTLESNEIFQNSMSGVRISGRGSSPVLRGNKILGNALGVHIHGEGGGLFEDNDLQGNIEGAWLITPDSEPLVTRRNNQE